jgi:hypothetical protein
MWRDCLKVADKTVYTMAQKAQLPAFKVRGQRQYFIRHKPGLVFQRMENNGRVCQPALAGRRLLSHLLGGGALRCVRRTLKARRDLT